MQEERPIPFAKILFPAALTVMVVLLLGSTPARAQQGVTTFGIQLKPVIPFAFFEPVTTVVREDLQATLELQGGLSFGMLVRTGITKSVSLEVGIDQITRRYDFHMVNDTNGYDDEGALRYVGYEVPVMCLIYIRLGERTWMNNALGFSLDLYPGDVKKELSYAQAYLFRRNWAQMGVVGNLGVEYRSKNSGYFYIGATFHRPFGDMAQFNATWLDRYQGLRPYTMTAPLSGSYLTLDLRYFFHEDPERRSRKGK